MPGERGTGGMPGARGDRVRLTTALRLDSFYITTEHPCENTLALITEKKCEHKTSHEGQIEINA